MAIIAIIIVAFLVHVFLNKIYAKLWKKDLEADVQFQKEPSMEGEKGYLTETISNRKWMFLPILQVGFQLHRNLLFADGENASVSDQSYKRDIFSVGSYQKITRTIPFYCSKRGYYELKNIELVTRDLLLTGKHYETLQKWDQLYVYPRLLNDKRLDISFQKIMGSILAKRNLYEDPFEFRGIREYQPMDPMNKINWKASARSDQWMVNLYGSTSAQEVMILLDVEDETIWKYDEIHEEGIRLAASYASRCVENGIPVGVLTNGRDVLTKEIFQLAVGSGKQQVRLVNEGLSRLDLTQAPEPMEHILEKERQNLESTQKTYIMISKNQRVSCYELFLELLHQGTNGIWISTLYNDMELTLPQNGNLPLIYWEVEK